MSPLKGGRAIWFFPQMILKAPRIRMETPMVIKIRTMTDRDLAGRMASLSTRPPTTVTAKTPRRKASGRGRPKPDKKVYIIIPPRVTKSTWVKLTIPMALWTMPKTQGDQGIDAPGGQAGDDKLG